MERMSDAGLVEQAPGAAHPPTFRLMPQQQQKQQQQQRQGGGRRIGVQPKVGRHPSLHTGGNGSHQVRGLVDGSSGPRHPRTSML